MEKLELGTPDLTSENIEKIAELFPQVISEAMNEEGELRRVIDFDALKQELSEEIVEGSKERYQFTWPGKQEAKLEARRPINKTLRPVRDESVDFDTTENLYIEGDNLDALKLLRNTYAGKIKMIYIDPPYNTGNDLIYDDDFSKSTAEYADNSGDFDESGGRLVSNLSSSGRFHSDWCSMIYPRLLLAKDMMSSDGVIFISIDDNEVVQLRKICDEIFGADNFVALVTRIAKRTSDKGTHFRPTKDYIIVYAKTLSLLPEFGVSKSVDAKEYNMVDDDGRRYKKSGASLFQPSLDSRPNQRYYIEAPDGSFVIPPGTVFPEKKADGAKVTPLSNIDKVWRWSQETYFKQKHLLIFTKGSTQNPLLDEYGNQSNWNIYPKVFLDEDLTGSLHPEDVIYDYSNSRGTKELKALGIPFSFAKPSELIQYLINCSNTGSGSTVLDFFSGSSTTAQAVMQINAEDGGSRKFIMVQIPEITPEDSEAYQAGYSTISDIGKERIRVSGKKIVAESGLLGQSLDIGFRVLKIDSTNFEDTYLLPDSTFQTSLSSLAGNMKLERTPEDLLFEILPAFRIPLSAKYVTETIADKQVFNVNDGQLLACFDTSVTTETVEEIAKLKPLYAVFRDASFADDSAAANFEELFKTFSPDTVRKVV